MAFVCLQVMDTSPRYCGKTSLCFDNARRRLSRAFCVCSARLEGHPFSWFSARHTTSRQNVSCHFPARHGTINLFQQDADSNCPLFRDCQQDTHSLPLDLFPLFPSKKRNYRLVSVFQHDTDLSKPFSQCNPPTAETFFCRFSGTHRTVEAPSLSNCRHVLSNIWRFFSTARLHSATPLSTSVTSLVTTPIPAPLSMLMTILCLTRYPRLFPPLSPPLCTPRRHAHSHAQPPPPSPSWVHNLPQLLFYYLLWGIVNSRFTTLTDLIRVGLW